MINKQIKNIQSINLNYELIKNNVNHNLENNYKSVKPINKNITSYLKLILYTLVICIISIVSTTYIIHNNTPHSGNINPGKQSREYLEANFDQFIAFGAGSPTQLFSIDLILQTNLLNETDKTQLKTRLTNNNLLNSYCKIYLGIKDNKDIIQIALLSKPYGVLEYELNLNYKLIDILNEFEILSNQKLTNDFLLNSNFDDLIKEETSGIIINFKKTKDIYEAYFTSVIDEQIYVVCKK